MPKKPSLPMPYSPMEALLVDEIPQGAEWQYEPKWDGFRCIVSKEGDQIELQSKAGRSLTRYFPELVTMVQQIPAKRFVLDGEIVSIEKQVLDFDKLLQRIHPAASRVKKLAEQSPAHLMVFDFLSDETGKPLVDQPLSARRPLLERFAEKQFPPDGLVQLSPVTKSLTAAQQWLGKPGFWYDGLIAKRLDLNYTSGTRDGMQKYKPKRTADCVVGGFRYATKSRVIGSLLLGLYENGLLHHVGFTSGLSATERRALAPKLRKIIGPPGFTGRAPGGPSRWSTERTAVWTPLLPKLVVEVAYDHVTGDRFRHGTKLLRWRPDKSPEQCTMDQIRIVAA
jgi:ATP-dependent DNA ligase